MAKILKCPSCQERIDVTDLSGGSTVRCEACGTMVRIASGATGTVHISNTAMHGSGFRLEVYGTEGKLAARSPALLELSLVTLSGARSDETEHELPPPPELIEVPGVDLGSNAYNIAQLFRGFAKAVRSGKDLSPTFEDGARMHRMLEAIDRSSQSRSWVDIA